MPLTTVDVWWLPYVAVGSLIAVSLIAAAVLTAGPALSRWTQRDYTPWEG